MTSCYFLGPSLISLENHFSHFLVLEHAFQTKKQVRIRPAGPLAGVKTQLERRRRLGERHPQAPLWRPGKEAVKNRRRSIKDDNPMYRNRHTYTMVCTNMSVNHGLLCGAYPSVENKLWSTKFPKSTTCIQNAQYSICQIQHSPIANNK